MIIKKQSKQQVQKQETAAQTQSAEVVIEKEEKGVVFDLDNIDFAQRQERRRGDRRRGYRRIDDRNLVSRAQEEADKIKESAAKEGYRAGMEQAQSEVQEVRNSLMEFLQAKQEVFEFIAPDILEISVDIARKIVKKEIEQDPQIILNTILDSLKMIYKDESKVNIKVNPQEVSFVKEGLPELISKSGTEAKLSVSADESIEVGGCKLYTTNGVVDATISTQIEILKEALKGI